MSATLQVAKEEEDGRRAKYWEYCAAVKVPCKETVHRDKNLALNFYLSQTNQAGGWLPHPSTYSTLPDRHQTKL